MTLTNVVTTWMRCSAAAFIAPAGSAERGIARRFRHQSAEYLRLRMTYATLRLCWLLLGRPIP